MTQLTGPPVVAAAVKHANGKLDEMEIEPISDRVTPHSLRLAYASLHAASGDDPVYIADQLGHTDPRFMLTVYTKAVNRRGKLSGAYLAEYERALAWAALSTAERHQWALALRSRTANPSSVRRRTA